MRAALRLISRSAAACSSRAVSVECCASRQRARALVSASAAAASAASAASTARRLASTSPRAVASSPSIACEPAALGEPARRAGRRMGGDGKAVPAPEIALARNQPLAGLEQRREARPVGALDDADLAEPARQFRRRLHMVGERGRAVRQLRIGRIERRAGPAHRRGLIDRRVEIVAERGAERLLVALVDDERVHHRRPQILVLDREQLADRLGLGLEPLHAALGGGERRARGVEPLARAGMGDFRRARRVLGFGERGLCGRQRLRQRRRCRARRCRSRPGRFRCSPSSASSRAARCA